jgi:uncharacterized damage-inducible protein DinB
MIDHFHDEFIRYKTTAEKAIEQVSDEALNTVVAPEGNSIGMLMRHMSGNLVSRFTEFLGSDGEKPWRNRDGEFETKKYARDDLLRMWGAGWEVLERQLAGMTDEELSRPVLIRGKTMTVHEALCRSLAHMATHVGQIVLLARILATDEWRWITIPKGKSREYNVNPTLEKRPN